MAKTALYVNKDPGGVFTVTEQSITTGDIYYVDSTTGASTNSGTSPLKPMATISQAIALCTANKGDRIYVMPKHAEAAAAADTFDVTIAGVSIIGLGNSTQRPTITYGASDATCAIGAAAVTIENIRFVGNFTDVAVALDVEAAGDGATIRNCYFADSATNLDTLIFINVTNSANDVTIEGNRFCGTAGGEATNAIKVAGATNNLIIRNNIASGDWKGADGAIGLAGGASKNIMVYNNIINNVDDSVGLGMDIHATATGSIFGNFCGCDVATQEPITGGETCYFGENYGTDDPGVSALLTPSTTTNFAA
jgi:hypothetical protein